MTIRTILSFLPISPIFSSNSSFFSTRQRFQYHSLTLPISSKPIPYTIPFIRAQQSSSTPPDPQNQWKEEDPLLARLEAFQIPNKSSKQANGQLRAVYTFVTSDLSPLIDDFLRSPIRLATASGLSILFGFFSATSASTIIGSVADWDPLAAAVLLVWTESFTKIYYKLKRRSRLLQLINAFKIGLIYGMTIDAFKLST